MLELPHKQMKTGGRDAKRWSHLSENRVYSHLVRGCTQTEEATHLSEDRCRAVSHSLECRRWRVKALAFTVPPGATAQSYGWRAAGDRWRWRLSTPWEVCSSGK